MASTPSRMRAWQLQGGHGKLEDVIVLNPAAPAPDASSLGSDQLLVQVISAAINPIDYKIRESGWLGRAVVAADSNPGLDFCGRVVAMHPSVGPSPSSLFKTGERVFGSLTNAQKYGTLGEYIVVSKKECAPVPDTVKADDAAAIGTAAGTALKALRRPLFHPGYNVLVNGGSGGVGTYVIQFAKVLGASRIVATCSTGNVQLCRDLGADEVLDYKQADIVSQLRNKGQIFDLLIDNVSTPGLWKNSHKYLKPGGTFVQIAGAPSVTDMLGVLQMKLQSLWPGANKRHFHFIMSKGMHEDYIRMGQWLAEGKVRSVIDRTFEFEDVQEAFKHLRAGHTKGKIVVHVSKE